QKKKNKTTAETMDICLILQQLGEYKKALLILDKTIKNQSNNPELYNNRGVVLRFLEKKELAIKDFKKALKINPLFYQARINLAGLYFLSNNKNLARSHYLKIKEQKNLPPEVIELAKKELSQLQ
ncbi:MAG: tetratricopeptide repeat protein, partial [Elusimicrobiales bacterium]|nr:tetratricopeptide repeat protein [Elusimicrobiales bacterium]